MPRVKPGAAGWEARMPIQWSFFLMFENYCLTRLSPFSRFWHHPGRPSPDILLPSGGNDVSPNPGPMVHSQARTHDLLAQQTVCQAAESLPDEPDGGVLWRGSPCQQPGSLRPRGPGPNGHQLRLGPHGQRQWRNQDPGQEVACSGFAKPSDGASKPGHRWQGNVEKLIRVDIVAQLSQLHLDPKQWFEKLIC